MNPNIMEIGVTIISRAKESILGLMEGNIKVNGKKIICMVMVFIHGLTAVDMMVIMPMIKRMVKEPINGQMVVFT